MIDSKDRKHFKKPQSNAPRSRMEATILLRKGKKEEHKRRLRLAASASKDCSEWMIQRNPTDATADTDLSDDCQTIEPVNSVHVGTKKVRLNTTNETVVMLMTRLRTATSHQFNDDSKYLEQLIGSVQDIRRLMSDQVDPPIGTLLAHGLLPHLTSLIQFHKHPTLLFEALWCFVCVSSSKVSSHVEAIVSSGVVCHIANLLVHGNPGVCEHAIWFVANIAGENDQYRDGLIGMKIVSDGLLHHMTYPANLSVLSTCAWAISNLFRGQSSNVTSLAIQFIPEIVAKTSFGVKGRVPASELVDLMSALLSITDCCSETCAIVIKSGALPMLIDAISYYHDLPNTTMLLIPVVRMIWEFSAGTEEQTSQVVDSGFLTHALPLLKSGKKHIRRDVLLTISNIGAGTHSQIDELFKHRSLMKEIARLANDGPAAIKKEALWTMSNIVTQGTLRHGSILVHLECIDTFCKYLTAAFDDQVAVLVLEAIEKLLSQNKKREMSYIELFYHCNGVQAIEDLQSSKVEKIYEMSVQILIDYFGGAEDDDESCEDQNMAPLVSAAKTTFEFGTHAFPAKQLFPENVEMIDNADSARSNVFTGSTTQFY